MARASASRGSANSDGTSGAILAQQRIFQVFATYHATTTSAARPLTPSEQLKKERDEKTKDVLAKVLADLDDIKDQVSQEREEHERLRKQKKAEILHGIAISMQKRSVLEENMVAVVSDVNRAMAELESNVLEIYEVKESSVQQLVQAAQERMQ
ncbi:hypothetical protein PWT90_02991 [Aphanocladium album]|nr:hypothetical protein PWT90_02991 [Aphanocladium album]